jgi:hypothetical protein
MPFNETIIYGNVTEPVVSLISKVDIAADGGLTMFIHIFLFLFILMALYKRNGAFLKGLVVAGVVTGVLNSFLTVVGVLSWKWIWIAVTCFVVAFIAKNMEN